MTNIIDLINRFPDQESCIKHLEHLRWGNEKATCPYCKSQNTKRRKSDIRIHCNSCLRNFSVTVDTVFHKTKIPLQKWFLAITLMLNAKKGLSAKQLERDLGVTYKTAWFLCMRIRQAMIEERDLLGGIVEIDEAWVGGKPRKNNIRKGDSNPQHFISGVSLGGYHVYKELDEKPKRKRGKGTERPSIIGVVSRETGEIVLSVKDKQDKKFVMDFVKKNIDPNHTIVYSDSDREFSKIGELVEHKTVNHNERFADGDIHTNRIEGFWSILKRGIHGQYHHISIEYLPMYLAEFQYKYNHKYDKAPETFEKALFQGVKTRFIKP